MTPFLPLPLLRPILAVLGCSAVTFGLIGVVLLAPPATAGWLRSPAVTGTLVALAIGSLIGDVAFHLVPEAWGKGDPLAAGLGFMLGILAFLVGERILQQNHSGHGHAHIEPINSDAYYVAADGEEGNNTTTGHVDNHQTRSRHIGVLLVASDLVHNFIDGVALAVAYAASPAAGHSTAVAICMHEIPHELGDFAILMACGYIRPQLLAYALATSGAAVLGVLAGLVLEGLVLAGGGAEPFVMAFSAGNFIYLALSDLVPEMLHQRGSSDRGGFLLIEHGAVVGGSLLMLLFKVVFD